jgi:general secretion pathway protein M
MSSDHPVTRYLTDNPVIAGCVYVALLLICLGSTWMALADLSQRYAVLSAARVMLAQIEAHRPPIDHALSSGGLAPPGSPFLDGQSLTMAAAALQQRVTDAVTKPGGNVLSAQVDLTSAPVKAGIISLIVSCELDQPSLQKALYDLEAGMPFLFIDQLDVESPQATGREDGPMRVLMTVSGQWRNTR